MCQQTQHISETDSQPDTEEVNSEEFYVLKTFKMNYFSLVIGVVLLAFCVEKGFCIKCWECRSDSDPKCADPFDNSTLSITDCKQVPLLEHLPGVKPTMCRKIRQKVNGEWRYFRSCAFMGEPGIVGDERFCLMRTGTYNIFMEYCQCNSKDGCNGADHYSSSVFTMISGILIVALKYVAQFSSWR